MNYLSLVLSIIAILISFGSLYFEHLQGFKLNVAQSEKMIVGFFAINRKIIIAIQGILVNSGQRGKAIVDYVLEVTGPGGDIQWWLPLMSIDDVEITGQGFNVKKWSPSLTKWIGPASDVPFWIGFEAPIDATVCEGQYNMALRVRIAGCAKWWRYPWASFTLTREESDNLNQKRGAYWRLTDEVRKFRQRLTPVCTSITRYSIKNGTNPRSSCPRRLR